MRSPVAGCNSWPQERFMEPLDWPIPRRRLPARQPIVRGRHDFHCFAGTRIVLDPASHRSTTGR
eukprot:9153893-Alexandrium_andersonii.AAC.1